MAISRAESEMQLRIRVIGLILGLAFLVLAGRLWYLQIAQGSEYRIKSENNRLRTIRALAPRGQILDRKGRLLATTRPQISVAVTTSELKDPETVLQRLAEILGTTPDALKDEIKKHQIVPYLPVKVASDVSIQVISQVKEQQSFLPGVELQVNPVRVYPEGLGCHVLGYLSEADKEDLDLLKPFSTYGRGDYLGKMGLEQELNIPLRGVDGGQLVEVDASGRMTRFLNYQAPIPGDTVTVTLDRDVQRAAEQGLAGKTGSAVAINPQNGDIIAMAASPTFDSNAFARGMKPAEWQKIALNPKHPLQNRPIKNKYPPGSTFKIVTSTAGLECGAITDKTRSFCPGAYYLGRARFGCWGRHGTVDLTKAIAESCDVFFYEAGRRMGPTRLAKMARAYGLGQRTDIPLRGETKGTIPDPEWKKLYVHRDPIWHPGETVITSIGQGAIQATPLQMCEVTATVSNWGVSYKPRLIRSIKDPNGKNLSHYQAVRVIRDRDGNATGERKVQWIDWNIKPRPRVPASTQNLEKIRKGLRSTVTNGTGRIVSFPNLAVAAKTGSAEDPPRRSHAWFVCFAPYDKPTIAICVMVENGGHGGSTAGPVARKMLEAYFGIKNGGSGMTVRSD